MLLKIVPHSTYATTNESLSQHYFYWMPRYQEKYTKTMVKMGTITRVSTESGFVSLIEFQQQASQIELGSLTDRVEVER